MVVRNIHFFHVFRKRHNGFRLLFLNVGHNKSTKLLVIGCNYAFYHTTLSTKS